MSNNRLSRNGWDSFFVSLLSIILTSFLPVFFEWIFTGNVSHATLAITAGIFSFSVGLDASRFIFLLIGCLMGFTNTGIYGFLIAHALSPSIPNENIMYYISIGSIIGFLIILTLDRFYKHIQKKECFLSLDGLRI